MQGQAAYNPFTVLPSTLCDEWRLPAISNCQEGTGYTQRRSEVAGIIMLPVGATRPSDWEDISDWQSTIDNTNTNNTKAKYMVGIGSFLPDTLTEISLSGGRLVESRERTYRLNMAVLNIDDGHSSLCRKLQTNLRKFDFWLYTVDDRLIGGPYGMRPTRVNADFVLNAGRDSREVWNITLTTSFLQYPAMTAQEIDFSNCADMDIQTLLASLPQYINDDAALLGGLSAGDAYWVLPGNDIQPADTIRRIPT